MKRMILPALLVAAAIIVAGCSVASSPTFNAYSIDAGDCVKTYKVECGGLFETMASCIKEAQRICGTTPVHPVAKTDRLRSASDTSSDSRTLLFRCESDTHASVKTPIARMPDMPEAKTIEHFTLQSDALFKFGKSNPKSMLSAGRAPLDQAIDRIEEHNETAGITIVGHTDRIDPASVNRPLSVARANSVHEYLISHGLDGDLIHTEGVGSSQPVSHCPGGENHAVIECLQPDRRVSITVSGQS
jgi:OOP family OmpA-OmpF porin